MARVLDILFFVYFLTHIPICVFVDSQAVLPQWLYPQAVRLQFHPVEAPANWHVDPSRQPSKLAWEFDLILDLHWSTLVLHTCMVQLQCTFSFFLSFFLFSFFDSFFFFFFSFFLSFFLFL